MVVGSLAPETGRLALFVGADPLVRLPEFILGVVAARIVAARRVVPFWMVVPAVTFCGVGLLFFHGSPTGNSWTAPVWLVLIVLVAQATIRGRQVLARRWMVYAGQVSFGFYLVHQLVLHETFRSIGPGRGQTVVAFGLAVGLAAALHRFVEIPAQRAVVRPVRRTARRAPVRRAPARRVAVGHVGGARGLPATSS